MFIMNHIPDIPYLWGLSSSFSNSFIDFYSCEVVLSRERKKEERTKRERTKHKFPISFPEPTRLLVSSKVRIHNGGCYVLHVSTYEMFIFCAVLHETKQKMQTNSRECAVRLDIIFKLINVSAYVCWFLKLIQQALQLGFLSGLNRAKICRDISLPHTSRFYVATNRV